MKTHVLPTVPYTLPAHLWIGDATTLHTVAVAWLQAFFCPAAGCTSCRVCTQIAAHTHHAIQWFSPEQTTYTLSDIDHILALTPFILNEGDHIFIIIQHADRLSPAAANRLLKPLEEPAPGYHYVLFAERTDALLPTVQSRCVLTCFNHSTSGAHPLRAHFLLDTAHPLIFMQLLQKITLTEHDVSALLQELLEYWQDTYKQACLTHNQHVLQQANRVLRVLISGIAQPPMPGSAKLFLRQLFLTVHA